MEVHDQARKHFAVSCAQGLDIAKCSLRRIDAEAEWVGLDVLLIDRPRVDAAHPPHDVIRMDRAPSPAIFARTFRMTSGFVISLAAISLRVGRRSGSIKLWSVADLTVSSIKTHVGRHAGLSNTSVRSLRISRSDYTAPASWTDRLVFSGTRKRIVSARRAICGPRTTSGTSPLLGRPAQ
jgi:hypothetical protein